MSEKSLCFTYFLWILFGWIGAHHFYLGRDRQAFVWWSTLGGYFFCGWVRDFWRIPDYVDEANEEEEYMQNLQRRFKLRKTPPFNTSRFIGQIMISNFYGFLVRFAIPDGVPFFITGILVCIGITTGVYLVGNIGREKGPFWRPFFTCLATYGVLAFLANNEPSYSYCGIAAAGVFNNYREYRYEITNRSLKTRFALFFAGMMIVTTLWISFITYNATITYENGEKIKLRDSLVHFFKSPAWLDFRNTFWGIYSERDSKQWKHFYDDVIKAFDPTGEKNARKVLGVYEYTRDEEIRRAYKKLVVKWHPDRYKGEDRAQAEKTFIEIQQAYELLQKRKKARFEKTEF